MAFDLKYLEARASGEIRRFCPLLGEICIRGWTPKMGKEGEGDAALPRFGACAAWQPISIRIAQENQTLKIYGCADYDHRNELLAEVAKEVYQAAASTDKVANEVHDHHATIAAAMSDEAKARVVRSKIPLHGPRRLALDLEGPAAPARQLEGPNA